MKAPVLASLVTLLLLGLSCGGSLLTFTDVAGIMPGNGAGDALSGPFAAVLEVTSGSCSGLSSDSAPQTGTTIPIDLDVIQDDGTMEMTKVETATLRGGVNFDNSFELGGSSFLDVEGQEENVQRLVQFIGNYENANSFVGNLEERFFGQVNGEPIDCTYTFRVTANRK